MLVAALTNVKQLRYRQSTCASLSPDSLKTLFSSQTDIVAVSIADSAPTERAGRKPGENSDFIVFRILHMNLPSFPLWDKSLTAS
jgi:hypothetical protein